MQNIYIDSFQIHSNTVDIGIFVKPKIIGLDISSIRLSSYDKIGEWGSFVSNLLYGGRLVSMEGFVYANSIATFNTRRRNLENAIQINKDSNSVPIAHLVKLTTMDGLALQFNAYLKNFQMDITDILYGEFKLDLFSPDFSLDNQTQTSVTLGVASGGGIVIPAIFPMVLSAASGGAISAVNNGNCDAFPVLTLTGPLTNPILFNDTLGRFLELNYTLTSGNTITIDMKNKTIIAGTTPLMSAWVMGSQWWWLNAGSNTLRLATSNNADTGNVSIAFRDAYLGV